MQRPYLEEVAFEEDSSEADSLGSMEDNLLLENELEQPHNDVEMSSSTPPELARSETKYFDAGKLPSNARPPTVQLLNMHLVLMSGCMCASMSCTQHPAVDVFRP